MKTFKKSYSNTLPKYCSRKKWVSLCVWVGVLKDGGMENNKRI